MLVGGATAEVYVMYIAQQRKALFLLGKGIVKLIFLILIEDTQKVLQNCKFCETEAHINMYWEENWPQKMIIWFCEIIYLVFS